MVYICRDDGVIIHASALASRDVNIPSINHGQIENPSVDHLLRAD